MRPPQRPRVAACTPSDNTIGCRLFLESCCFGLRLKRIPQALQRHADEPAPMQIDHILQQRLPSTPRLHGAHTVLAELEQRISALPACQLDGSNAPELEHFQQASIAMTFRPPECLVLTGPLLLSVRRAAPRRPSPHL